MNTWGWIIGYVVLFALLHFFLYYYYVRQEDDEDVSSPSLSEPDRGRPKSASRPNKDHQPQREAYDDPAEHEGNLEFDGETIECPRCGARNEADPTYSYCWNCVSSLSQTR